MNNLALKLKSFFFNKGFNLFKIINSSKYDELSEHNQKTTNMLRGSHSVIIVGFMGNNFWNVLNDYVSHNPQFTQSTEDIIDDYSNITVNEALDLLGKYSDKVEAVFPFRRSSNYLDFRTLGKLSGIGVESILGLLINPEYGSWISFRGAILTDIKFDRYDKPLIDFDPCPSCTKPCILACPAKTISVKEWDWNKCLDFRVKHTECNTNCYSRRACPYGEQHQYCNEQFNHHHKFVLKNYINYSKDLDAK